MLGRSFDLLWQMVTVAFRLQKQQPEAMDCFAASVSPQQQLRHRLADQIAAPEHDGVLACRHSRGISFSQMPANTQSKRGQTFDLDVVPLEQLDAAQRCAADQRRLHPQTRNSPHVRLVQPIHILSKPDEPCEN